MKKWSDVKLEINDILRRDKMLENIKVYGLEESIIASGYAMLSEFYTEEEFKFQVANLSYWMDSGILSEIIKRELLYKNEKYNYQIFPNEIKINKDTTYIITRTKKGEITGEYMIDDEDLQELLKFKWYSLTTGYAQYSKEKIFMHKYIASLYVDDIEIVDHINRNVYDNRKNNLRTANKQQNVFNMSKRKNSDTPIIGVQVTEYNTFRAIIGINGQTKYLGSFKQKSEAIKCRLEAEKLYFGEYAPQIHLFEQYGIPTPDVSTLETKFKFNLYEAYRHYKRVCKLGNTPANSGHGNYLTGIVVHADLTCSQAMMLQLERYHFFQIVTSGSKIHRLTKMNIPEQCNEYVTDETVEQLATLICDYNYMTEHKEHYSAQVIKEQYLTIIYNCPMGLNLTFRFTTNYLQLKTIYNQRKHHKLQEWKAFCNWLMVLPHFKELTGCGLEKEDK